MSLSPNCRVTALLTTMTLLTLAGCGVGSSIGEDIGNAIGNGLTCGLRNCTESSTLRVDEMGPRFTASQQAGSNTVLIEGFMGKSANLFTTVLLGSNERLSASVDGSSESRLNNPDGQRLDYTLSLVSSSAQPQVTLVFTRDGTRHVSQVTLPPAFSVLQPTGTATLTRTGAALAVRLSRAFTVNDTLTLTADGRCTRSDNSAFDVKSESLGAQADASVPGTYTLQPLSTDTTLNAASVRANNNSTATSPVSRCELTLTWGHKVYGTVAATLNQHGTLAGERRATLGLIYDAR